MNPERIVRDFCRSFETLDPQKILVYLAPDCFYHNIPMEPLRGHAAIEGFFKEFLSGCTAGQFEIKALAVNGSTVLTERVDRFSLRDGRRIELPVMGTFELRSDGEISAWRDYFDLATWTRQMA